MNGKNNHNKPQVQKSIKDFVTKQTQPDCLEQKKKKRRRKKKSDCLEQNVTPINQVDDTTKKRTPPSLEGEKDTKRALFFDSSPELLPANHSTPISDTTYQTTDTTNSTSKDNQPKMASGGKPPSTPPKGVNPESVALIEMENRLLAKLDTMLSEKITPISTSMNHMQTSVDSLIVSQKAWETHQHEFVKLKENNRVLENKVTKLELSNTILDQRLRHVEEQLGGCNIIISGLAEGKWEKEPTTISRVYDVISETIDALDYDTRLKRAKNMDIITAKRMGNWSKFKGRPVLVSLRRKSDAESVIENRKYLPKKVYVDYEYDANTTRARSLLRPILNKARRLENYKGKCKLEGDHLVLHGKHYTVSNLDNLPDDLNCQSITSTQSQVAHGFFGELNHLSNFHMCKFEHEGIIYHSTEQFIQRQKALLFKNVEIAKQIESSMSPLECKHLARNITNYEQDKWLNSAKELCEPGIYSKFEQNEKLKESLLQTGNLTLVESSYDKYWGTGIPLQDDRCLVSSKWHTQGLLGIILQQTRNRLKTENPNPAPPVTMDEAPP